MCKMRFLFFEELEEPLRFVVNTASNCVLEVCVACGDRKAAEGGPEGSFRRMEAAGQLDVISYTTQFKTLLAEGARDEVERVLKETKRLKMIIKPFLLDANARAKDAGNRIAEFR